MERKRCWESYESASRPAALIAFYFYTLLPPSYASQLVATGTPDSSKGTNTFSLVSMEKRKKASVHRATGGNDGSGKACTKNTWDTSAPASQLMKTHSNGCNIQES